ncbi:MAG: glycosyltransferase family 39 protein, partial [Gemmataceae bacterium]
MTHRYWLLLIALFGVYLGLAALVPYADDELYYWCWQERLQLSYYDHPVMTALMIRGSVSLFGDTLFAIRVPACLATLFTLGTIIYLSDFRRLLPWILLTPLFSIGAVIITPDTPLLLF